MIWDVLVTWVSLLDYPGMVHYGEVSEEEARVSLLDYPWRALGLKHVVQQSDEGRN